MTTLRNAILAMVLLLGILTTNSLASECATCKGSWKAGGGAYFILRSGEQFDPGEGYSNWGISFTPTIETFVSPGLSLGSEIILSYDHAGSKYSYRNITNYGMMPVISGYIPLGSSEREEANSFLLIRLGVGVAATNVKQKYPSWYYSFDNYRNNTSTTVIVASQIAFMPMLSRSVGLEIGTNVAYTSTEGRYGLTLQFGAGIAVFAL